MEGGGMEPASRIPQAGTPQKSCADSANPCLHGAGTDLALQKLIVCWHGLTPDVRAAVMQLVRGRG
jgi:hypothetical protein